jgi:hypothetical protein
MAFSSASLGDWAEAGSGARLIAKRTDCSNDFNARRRMAGLDLFRKEQWNDRLDGEGI